MVTAALVGVDPGARYAGVTAVRGLRTVVTWGVVDRDADGQDPQTYRGRVEAAVTEALAALDAGARVAIESVTAPNAHHRGKLKLTDPADLIHLARVVGWLERAFPGAVMVRPGGHGHRPWGTYPDALLTVRERVNAGRKPLAAAGQSSLMRHARSAFDVALAARMPA